MKTQQFKLRHSTSKEHKGNRNLPLQVHIQDGILFMAIGVETLAWASLEENGGPLQDAQIVNEDEFARDVSIEMMRENGDWQSEMAASKWLDEMVEAAAERGSAGISYAD